MFTMVDDNDYNELSKHKWYPEKRKGIFYVRRTAPSVTKDPKKRIKIYMHRQILGTPDGLSTDHRDCNGLNNQRSNLRTCTQAQNTRNQRKTRGSSEYKGVCWDKRLKKWRADIRLNKTQMYLGLFLCPIEAAKAYDEAANKYHGDFARLNFPTEPTKAFFVGVV